MGLNTYKPEGWKIDTPENRAAMASMTALMDACRDEKILEGRALVCSGGHHPGYCHHFPREPACLLYHNRISEG